jgi:alkylation response protein AidB-like acyl-CoA dehydrogenase
MGVVDKAMQIFGGCGFIRELPIESIYRNVKGFESWAGTTQIQKQIIVREPLIRMGGS